MPSEADMKAALQSYLDGFTKRDPELIVALFAEDAVIEDPFGTPPKQGIAAIREFYTNAVAANVDLTLDTPIRASQGAGAAMAFTIAVGPTTIKAIDVMEFDADGKITSMKAFWGTSDIATA